MNGSGIQRVVVGIDAGGTRTRARCADAATGTVLGEGTGGPGNALSVPAEELVRHLAEALRGALPPGAQAAVGAVVAGFAGGGPGGERPGPGRRCGRPWPRRARTRSGSSCTATRRWPSRRDRAPRPTAWC
ncbi:hypothetical protein AB6O49_07585 [Streptomyces sp. SBR177]